MRYDLLFVAAALAGALSCEGVIEQRNNVDARSNNGDTSADSGTTSGPTPRPDRDVGVGDTGGPTPTPSDVGGSADVAESPDVVEPPFDAGDCGGVTFGDAAFSLMPLEGVSANGLHAAASAGGGAFIGWRGGDGVHVSHVDGGGQLVTDTVVAGTALYGLAAHDAGRAVMVSRGQDILALVILDSAGAVVSDQTIIGDVPHDVTENEWFGALIRQGAMTWTGSQWALYYTVNRLWPDGVAHYGDQLRLYAADGSSYSTQWGWGCSHSMEVAISHNGDRLGPVCSSDCYPSKGVHFNHRGGELWPDETGSNCAGGYGTSIGASVPIPNGFWLAFTARDDRDSADVAIVKVEGSTPQTPVWLTDDTVADRSVRAANFGDDILVAWDSAGTNRFVVVSATDGSIVRGPVSLTDASPTASSDFFVYANGDVGWAQATSAGASLARLRVCDQ